MTKENTLKAVGEVAKSITHIWTVLIIISTIVFFLFKPYITPYVDLPEDIKQLKVAVTALTVAQSNSKPQVVSFTGTPQLVDANTKYVIGDNVQFMYFLRRNVSCDTELRVFFYNVATGTLHSGPTLLATKASITTDFIPFKVNVTVPPLPTGRYSYIPTLVPLNCGVYEAIKAPPSQIFEVL